MMRRSLETCVLTAKLRKDWQYGQYDDSNAHCPRPAVFEVGDCACFRWVSKRYSLPNLYYKGFSSNLPLTMCDANISCIYKRVVSPEMWNTYNPENKYSWRIEPANEWIVSSYDSQSSESPLSRGYVQILSLCFPGKGDFFLATIYTNHPSCDHGYLLHEIFPGPHFYTLLNKILKTSPPCGKEIWPI